LSLLVFVLVMAYTGPSQAQDNVVRRTTLVVNDIDRSLAFYRDVLGFELWLDLPGTVSENSLPSDAPPGAPSRFIIMKGRHPWVGMVGLLQYGESRTLPETPDRLRPGDAILMIETRDVDLVYRRMQAAGTPILRTPRSSEVTGADGDSWTARFLFAFDPDGHLLEINQREVAATPAEAAHGHTALRRKFVDYRYGQLHVREARPLRESASQPALLLFHQTPLSGRLYDSVLPLLAEDRVVYAVDTPGYGESDPPPRPLSIEQYAEAIGDFVATIPGQVDVMGYHTGVLLSMELARTMPAKVRRAVLVSIPMFSDEVRADYEPNRDPIDSEGNYLATMWQSRMNARADGQSIERVAQLVAEKQRAGTRSWWSGPAIFAYDTRSRLQEIKQPVMVLAPADTLHQGTLEATALLSDAHLRDMPEVEYGFFDTQPERVAKIVLEFLDE
jgi:pimeloyl-ACP methyl ester carboxylesterase/catechol 2,3-dioxygenase-like lactoylglutathione lyase family enzyme